MANERRQQGGAAPLARRADVPAMPQSPAEWGEYLRRLQQECFLIGAMTGNPEVPEGFAIDPQPVLLNVGEDTYKVGTEGYGDRAVEFHGITKSGIEALAIAAGASAEAIRTDKRNDPLVCEYVARASMNLLDGSKHTQTASRTYDLHPEGADYVKVFNDALTKKLKDFEREAEFAARDNRPCRNPPEAEWEMRAEDAGRMAVRLARGTMHTNCETKAKLRALRAVMRLNSKYKRVDLERKPFVVLRLKFTGRTADRVLAREFALMQARSFFSSTSALYGPAASAAHALPHHVEPTPHALPGAGDLGDDIDEETGEVLDAQAAEAETEAPVEPSSTSAAPPAPAATKPAAAPAQAAPSGPPPRSEAVVAKGLPHAGKRLCDLALEQLEELCAKLAAGVKAAHAKGGAKPDALAAAERFLETVRTEIDLVKPQAAAEGPAGGESDEEFMAGLAGGEA